MYSETPNLNPQQCWLPGDTTPTVTTMIIIGVLPASSLGLDLLKGKAWVDPKGREWKFSSLAVLIRPLQTVPLFPPSRVVNMKPYLLPREWRKGSLQWQKIYKNLRWSYRPTPPYNFLLWKPNEWKYHDRNNWLSISWPKRKSPIER